MCGIVGYVSSGVRDADGMINALGHRGPDACGAYRADINGRAVFLGHTRLSIIDLSEAGTQPMFTADRRIALVFNGEIYNFQELKRRFLGDVQFRSSTDTEVLLALYERMGMDFLQHLNGDFAIAIMDHARGRLCLIRDRVGIKPLYFWQRGDDLVFGSEIKALLAGGVPAELDRDQVQPYFVFKYVPGTATLFRGVARLAPGHFLEYDLATGRTRIAPYWQPRSGTNTAISYREACEEVAQLVEDATRIRLVADVPVGTFLSGGLDSSIIGSLVRDQKHISHYCARQSREAVRNEGTTSDFDHASRLAAEWDLDFHPVDIGADQLSPELIRKTVFFADDLIADSAQIPTYLITQGASATSRVFLSGMGADEIFLGYAGHILTLLSSQLGRVPGNRLIRDALGRLDEGRGVMKSARRYLYKLGKYRDLGPLQPAVFSLVGDFARSASVVSGSTDGILRFLEGYFPGDVDAFEGLKRFEFDNFLQKNLSYTDRMAMANAVEVRVPFLDHRLVDLAYSLPRDFKLGNLGRSKRILKDTFGPRLPDYVTKRRKAGFAMPIRSLFSSRGAVLALLDLPMLADVIPLQVDAVDSVIDRHADGSEDNSALIYALISFQEWYRKFFVH